MQEYGDTFQQESLTLAQAVDQVGTLAKEYGLWSQGDVIVVAVSGGPDSVALLHILTLIARGEEMPLKLVVAHVNHGFRPKESQEEAVFVQQLAASYGWPFELAKFDVPSYRKEHGMGGQEAARSLRYTFLLQVAKQYGAVSIATAHHGDDQAETVLLRLIRGSGLTGIGGMKVKRRMKNVELLRPLLRMYKTDLLHICREAGLRFVTDSSNLLNKYARNAVRLDVLPFLGQYNGQLVQALNRLSLLAESEDSYMAGQAAEAFSRLAVREDNGTIRLNIASLARLHVALQRRLIKLILTYLPLNTEESDFPKVEAIRKGALQEHPTTWRIDLGGGTFCLREYGVLSFFLKEHAHQPFSYRLETAPASLFIAGTGQILSVSQLPNRGALPDGSPPGRNEALFDADELMFPLTVRSRLPGDSMQVLGLAGTKKVKNIFIDEKIPPSLRSQIPVVTDAAGRIVWIPGVRRSGLGLVRDREGPVIRMQYGPADE